MNGPSLEPIAKPTKERDYENSGSVAIAVCIRMNEQEPFKELRNDLGKRSKPSWIEFSLGQATNHRLHLRDGDPDDTS
jgi:hypothetical protein